MKAYYFSPADRRLANGDGREIAIGATHKVDGPPVLCSNGLHASLRIIDALEYANSSILYEVDLSGEIAEDDNKSCATERTYLRGGICLADTLWAFARWCALSVADKWDMSPVVREYLETGDESKRSAAESAARSAARSDLEVKLRELVEAAWAKEGA